jgi:CRP-like cAMP-binding protein
VPSARAGGCGIPHKGGTILAARAAGRGGAGLRKGGVAMSQQTFLDRLAPEDRARLEAAWQPRRYAAGETLLHEGDEEGDVFVLLEGRATASALSAQGRLVAYADIREGDVFGEIAAMDGGLRSANLVAATPLVAGRLPAPAFRRIVLETPGLALALLGHMAGRLRDMNRRVLELSTMAVRERLVRELVRLAGAAERGGRPVRIAPAPTHRDLAARISTHREAVSREMSRLARLGLVARAGRGLVIEDATRLRALAEMLSSRSGLAIPGAVRPPPGRARETVDRSGRRGAAQDRAHPELRAGVPGQRPRGLLVDQDHRGRPLLERDRPAELLQAEGAVHRVAHRRDVDVLAEAERAEHDGPGRDADAHRVGRRRAGPQCRLHGARCVAGAPRLPGVGGALRE